MKHTFIRAVLGLVIVAAFAVSAVAQTLIVPQGTNVNLVFDQPLSSRTAQVGQLVRFHVANDVVLNGHRFIRAGTPVTGVVSKVNKRKAYGVNAKLRIALNPVRLTTGVLVPLEPRSKGQYVAGKKSGQAAAATAGGAIIAGPIGLLGGYFVKGKPVNIRAGEILPTEVAQNIAWTPNYRRGIG